MHVFYLCTNRKKKQFRGRNVGNLKDVFSRKKPADLTFYYEVEKIIFERKINLS